MNTNPLSIPCALNFPSKHKYIFNFNAPLVFKVNGQSYIFEPVAHSNIPKTMHPKNPALGPYHITFYFRDPKNRRLRAHVFFGSEETYELSEDPYLETHLSEDQGGNNFVSIQEELKTIPGLRQFLEEEALNQAIIELPSLQNQLQDIMDPLEEDYFTNKQKLKLLSKNLSINAEEYETYLQETIRILEQLSQCNWKYYSLFKLYQTYKIQIPQPTTLSKETEEPTLPQDLPSLPPEEMKAEEIQPPVPKFDPVLTQKTLLDANLARIEFKRINDSNPPDPNRFVVFASFRKKVAALGSLIGHDWPRDEVLQVHSLFLAQLEEGTELFESALKNNELVKAQELLDLVQTINVDFVRQALKNGNSQQLSFLMEQGEFSFSSIKKLQAQ